MALSWSLFGLLAVMCGGLLASLHALVGRMDSLRNELTGRMDLSDRRIDRLGRRMGRLESRLGRLESRMDGLTAEVHLFHADVDRRLSDGGL